MPILATVGFAAMFLLQVASASAQSGYDLFQQALVKERSNGQIQQAIALYQRIVAEHATDRALSAKALVQMGRAYETLGSAEAREPYERVLRDFPDQEGEVGLARARLAVLTPPAGAVAPDSGMHLRRVWVGPELDGINALSRDGRYLSFVDWSTGDLGVRDLVTGDKRRVTSQAADSPEFALYSTFSPDGRQVAFTWETADGVSELRIVGIDGSGLRTLYHNEAMDAVYVAEWSPDGTHLAAIFRNASSGLQIALISVADGSARVLKSLQWRYPTLRFSPDGRHIAYSINVDDNAPQDDVFLIATDGSSEVPLVQHPANDEVAAWTPDGRGLLIHSDRTGTAGLWLVPIADAARAGEPALVRPGVGGTTPLTVSSTAAFYYLFSRYMYDVYAAAFDPATAKPLDAPAKVTERFIGANSGPDWSPDGRYLALTRGTQNGAVVVLRSELDGTERELPMDLPRLHYRGPRWSPDGNSMLIFGPDRKGRWGLYHVAVQTGAARPVTLHAEGGFVQQWQWTPDGTGAAYIRDQQIMIRDLATGRETALVQVRTPESGGGLEFSRDGRWLAYTTQDSATKRMMLHVMSAAGGPPRELVRVEPPYEMYSPTWTPDGRYVLFTQMPSRHADPNPRGARRTELWRADVATGVTESMGIAMDGLVQVRVRPDGRRMAFTASSGMVELWVMENFLPSAAIGTSGGRP